MRKQATRSLDVTPNRMIAVIQLITNKFFRDGAKVDSLVDPAKNIQHHAVGKLRVDFLELGEPSGKHAERFDLPRVHVIPNALKWRAGCQCISASLTREGMTHVL